MSGFSFVDVTMYKNTFLTNEFDYIVFDECHEETIVREIKEKLNSTVEPIKYIGLFNYQNQNISPYDDFSITLYAYKFIFFNFKLAHNGVLTYNINAYRGEFNDFGKKNISKIS